MKIYGPDIIIHDEEQLIEGWAMLIQYDYKWLVRVKCPMYLATVHRGAPEL